MTAVYHHALFSPGSPTTMPSTAAPIEQGRRAADTAPRVIVAALACMLGACSEPSRNADFHPEADQAALSTAPAAPAAGQAPVELTYDERKAPLLAGAKCNLERANGKLFAGEPLDATRSRTLTLVGWVANVGKHEVPASVDIRLVAPDSRVWKVSATPGIARTDVQSLLGGDAAFAKAGFAVDARMALPAGTYRSYVVFKDGDGLTVCDNGRAIRVAD